MTNARQWVHVLQGGAWILPLFGATGEVLAYMETRSPAIALPIIGLAISLGALALAASKLQRDAADGQSKTYLDAAVTAYGEAEQLVLEEGAGRVEWIGAGRALAYARRFADQIDVSAHKEVLELRQMRARRVLHGALNRPAAFFYGVDPDLPLDEAARHSSATRTVNGRVQISFSKALTESSLYEVWLATQWPDDYKDLLQHKFEEIEIRGGLLLFRGLEQYLTHIRQWHSVAGHLHERDVGRKAYEEATQ